MSLRPLKFTNEGAFRELLTSEEDYLAYKAGLHLSKMDINDLSAISTNTQAELVGSFENTFYTSGVGSVAGETISRTYNVTHTSDPSGSTHTTTFGSITNLPSVVYVGDTIQITISGTATSTGTGFAEIEYQLGVLGDEVGSVSVTATPTATNITGLQTTWEDFGTQALSGSYSTTFSFTVTTVGILNITLNATSTDPNNSIAGSFDDEDLPSIQIQAQTRPNTSSVVYQLYQNNADVSAIDEQHPSIINPVYWDRTASPAGLKEMNDTELDTVIENLLRKIFSSDLPGQYRLAAEAPSEHWSEFIADVFFDTRGDNSQINYSIWVKSSSVVPTPVKIVAPVRIPLTNQFGGFRELSGPQLEYTFGEKMKRTIQTTGIGKYQLRSSEQGAPTDTGVWEARGNAVDTNLTYQETTAYLDIQRYGNDYVSSYDGIFTTDYLESYNTQVNPSAGYEEDYTGVSEERYTGNYTQTYATTTNYNNESVVSYSDITENYVSGYQTDFTGTYEGDFQSNYISLYLSNYESDTSEDYTDTIYAGDYISDYENTYLSDYTVSFETSYITDDYLGDYATEYAGDVLEPYEGMYEGADAENYIGNIPTEYTGDYITSFEGVYSSVYVGNYDVGTYEVYSVDVLTYEVEYTISTEVLYEAEYTQSTYAVFENYIENSYEGDEFSEVYISDSYEGNLFVNYTRFESFISDVAGQGGIVGEFQNIDQGEFTTDYLRGYDGPPNDSYDGYTGYLNQGVIGQNTFTTSFTGDYTSEDTNDYFRDYTSSYTGVFRSSLSFTGTTGGTAYNSPLGAYVGGTEVSYSSQTGPITGTADYSTNTYIGPSNSYVAASDESQYDEDNYYFQITTVNIGSGEPDDYSIEIVWNGIEVYSLLTAPDTDGTFRGSDGAFYSRSGAAQYTSGATSKYTVNRAGTTDYVYYPETTYSAEYLGTDYIRDYTAEYTGSYYRDYIRNDDYQTYVRSYEHETHYQNEFIDAYLGDTFEGNYLRSYDVEIVEAYTGLTDGPSYSTDYAADFTQTVYTADYIGLAFDNSFPNIFTVNYIVDVATNSYESDFEGPPRNVDYNTGYASEYESDVELLYVGDYTSEYEIDYTGNYQSGYEDIYSTPYEGNYIGNYETAYETDYNTDYSGNYVTDYSLNVYTGEYEVSYAGNFTNTFAGNYLDDFEGTFTREFSSTYSHTPEYTGDLVVTQYEGVYEKDFLSVYISENVQNYTSVVDIIEADYSVAYSTDYDGTYESSYSKNFVNIDGELGDGSGSDLLVPSGSDRLVLSDSLIFRVVAANTGVEGSYISDDAQLTSTPIILETYTLYARVA